MHPFLPLCMLHTWGCLLLFPNGRPLHAMCSYVFTLGHSTLQCLFHALFTYSNSSFCNVQQYNGYLGIKHHPRTPMDKFTLKGWLNTSDHMYTDLTLHAHIRHWELRISILRNSIMLSCNNPICIGLVYMPRMWYGILLQYLHTGGVGTLFTCLTTEAVWSLGPKGNTTTCSYTLYYSSCVSMFADVMQQCL